MQQYMQQRVDRNKSGTLAAAFAAAACHNGIVTNRTIIQCKLIQSP